MKIQIYYSFDFLPFTLYLNTLSKILEKHIEKPIFIKNFSEFLPDTEILFIYMTEITKIYNVNTNNTKIIFINADSIIHHYSQEDKFMIDDYIKNKNPNNIYLWEYNTLNIRYYNDNYPNVKYDYIPLTYDKYLEDIYNSHTVKIPWEQKDIDILFVGYFSDRRNKMIGELCKSHRIYIMQGVSDIQQYVSMVERSKIVINIIKNENNKSFDYYRLALLYSNKVFILNETFIVDENLDKHLDKLLENIVQVDYDNFPNGLIKCLSMSKNEIDENTNKVYDEFKKLSMESNIINFFDKFIINKN